MYYLWIIVWLPISNFDTLCSQIKSSQHLNKYVNQLFVINFLFYFCLENEICTIYSLEKVINLSIHDKFLQLFWDTYKLDDNSDFVLNDLRQVKIYYISISINISPKTKHGTGQKAIAWLLNKSLIILSWNTLFLFTFWQVTY